MYVKIHKSKDSAVTAICDEELIGKTFSDSERQLDVNERFYKGEKKSEKEVEDIMKEASNLNLVGENTINVALKLEILTKDSIITIEKIPHAQVFEI
jgi:uncharacterized protein